MDNKDTSQKYDPNNEEHNEYNDLFNEYIDLVVEDGIIPTIEEFKAELGDEVFDDIIDKLGLPFIEGKFNTPFIENLKLENLSKEQKDIPLVERGQNTLGEDARQAFDEIGRTYRPNNLSIIQNKTNKLKFIKIPFIIFAFIFGVLILTNPSPKAFYYYSKGIGQYEKHSTYRKTNYFIFSIYVQINLNTEKQETYLGVLGNFWKKKETIFN
jgi:hypothetical protein